MSMQVTATALSAEQIEMFSMALFVVAVVGVTVHSLGWNWDEVHLVVGDLLECRSTICNEIVSDTFLDDLGRLQHVEW